MGVGKYYTPEGPTGAAGLPPQESASIVDVSFVKEMGSPPALDPAAWSTDEAVRPPAPQMGPPCTPRSNPAVAPRVPHPALNSRV